MPNPLSPTSVDEIKEIVRDAIARDAPLEPLGGGTRVHVGYEPGRPLTPVSLAGMNEIIDYAPEDLVIVAQAGITLSRLDAVLAAHNQALPLEVANPEARTLGGVIASRADSLNRAANGSVRDWLIGCRVVGGEAEEIVAGGKVVKNVAGYDLPKLYCGSWGTLGIIHQAAFRVGPRPERARQLLVSLNTDCEIDDAVGRLQAAVSPTFAYLLNTDAARAILGGDAPPARFLAVGFDGHGAAVDAQCARAKSAIAADAFQIIDLTDEVGARMRVLLRDIPAQFAEQTLRLSVLPSQTGALARILEWTARKHGFSARIAGDAVVGIVWMHMSPRDSDESDIDAVDRRRLRLLPDLLDKIDRAGARCVFERMPKRPTEAEHPIWTPEPESAKWTRQIKSRLDPHGVFRPGRFLDRV
jgi:glycolate oxidase FAD binding subunit